MSRVRCDSDASDHGTVNITYAACYVLSRPGFALSEVSKFLFETPEGGGQRNDRFHAELTHLTLSIWFRGSTAVSGDESLCGKIHRSIARADSTFISVSLSVLRMASTAGIRGSN
jgi:hypothetical protein